MRVYRSRNKTIAVIGAYPGAGATHLCLCIANYMASKEKQKVIYIELGENSALENMTKGDVVELDGVLGYKYMGVTYVLSASTDECYRLLKTRSEYIVVDFRANISKNISVLNACSKVIIMGSYKPWNEDRFGSFIQKNIIDKFDNNKILFFSLGTNRREKTSFQKVFKSELHDMPIILNPLCINRKEFQFFNCLIEE